MMPGDELQQRWLKLESLLTERLGKKPDLDDVLLFIGKKESGLPPKNFTEEEQLNLRQMAICTILVPARYYELYWVDDMGWPHFNQLQRLPEMSLPEKEVF
ncbi:MAG: hypothetical protein IPP72_17765 [Chitinophagaceae bacterium]|nr:hypothetical protein [Chitinophagaceae bacterium]